MSHIFDFTHDYSLKPLRPFQDEGLRNLFAALETKRRVLAVAPPGAGKTVLASYVAASIHATSKRLLFIAHRRELIDQTSRTFKAAGIPHGIVMANDRRGDPTAAVQIATIQTLRRRPEAAPDADMVVVDEAHLGLADSYVQMLDNRYAHAKVLGLTGTPERLDGKGLGSVFDDILVMATAAQLVSEGYLVAPTVYAPSMRPDFSKLRVANGDYRDRDLDALMNTAALCGDVVEHWMRHARGRPTIVFAVNQDHSQHLASSFITAGVAAEHVDCRTPKAERELIFARLRSGTTRVICNVDICTEGFDFPALGCVILARPTKSWARCIQAVGRVMRAAPGKTDALCLDHAGSVFEHGFPTDPRDVSLDGIVPPKPQDLEPCPKCEALLRTDAERCITCGWVRPAPPLQVSNDDAERNAPMRDTSNDDGALELLRPEDRPKCEHCGHYQGRANRTRMGLFTLALRCSSQRCGKTSYVTDHAAVESATHEQKEDEFERLKTVCARFGGQDWWPAWKFKQTFGHAPKGARRSA